jgi:hypothetical protein
MDWQPIATAAKDYDKAVLLAWPNGRREVGRWSDQQERWLNSNGSAPLVPHLGAEPTLWHPIPELQTRP